MSLNSFISLLLLAIILNSCDSDGILRGYEEKSPNENSYLVVEPEKGGGRVGEVYIDHEKWTYQLGEKGLIAPGTHCISHSKEDGVIRFKIKPNTVFHFNYWGP